MTHSQLSTQDSLSFMRYFSSDYVLIVSLLCHEILSHEIVISWNTHEIIPMKLLDISRIFMMLTPLNTPWKYHEFAIMHSWWNPWWCWSIHTPWKPTDFIMIRVSWHDYNINFHGYISHINHVNFIVFLSGPDYVAQSTTSYYMGAYYQAISSFVYQHLCRIWKPTMYYCIPQHL